MNTASSVLAESQPAVYPRAKRPLKPVAERLLIVGLDGATFEVLDPLLGCRPHAEP